MSKRPVTISSRPLSAADLLGAAARVVLAVTEPASITIRRPSISVVAEKPTISIRTVTQADALYDDFSKKAWILLAGGLALDDNIISVKATVMATAKMVFGGTTYFLAIGRAFTGTVAVHAFTYIEGMTRRELTDQKPELVWISDGALQGSKADLTEFALKAYAQELANKVGDGVNITSIVMS